MGLITRSRMRSYMDCGGTYHEIGEGFTEFTENKNPKEYARQYINEAAERTDLVGFAPSVTFAFDVYAADPVQEKILAAANSEAVGEDAHVTVVTAFLHRAVTGGDGVEAVRRVYTVCPEKLGSGTDALICSGNLKACGEPEPGVFDPETLTFTADGTADDGNAGEE